MVEVLVAIGLMAGIVVSIVAIFSYSLKSNKIIWEQLETQNQGRAVVQVFSKELRMATVSSLGAYPLAEASSTQIIFYADLDNDSLREKVRYFIQGDIFKKGVTKPTGNPLAYLEANEVITDMAYDVDVSGDPTFSYYDEDFTGSGIPLTHPVNISLVRAVKISLKLEEDPYASPVPFHIETKVNIRNLKGN